MDYLISEISNRTIKEESSLRSDSAFLRKLSILLVYLIIELDPLIRWFRCHKNLFIGLSIPFVGGGEGRTKFKVETRTARKFMYDRGADWNALSRHRRLLWTWRECESYRAYPQDWRSSYSSTSDEHLIHRHDWIGWCEIAWDPAKSLTSESSPFWIP